MQAAPAQSGCMECVWEVYQKQMLEYQAAKAKAEGKEPPADPFAALEAKLYGTDSTQNTA